MYAIDRQSIIDNIYGGSGTIVPCLYVADPPAGRRVTPYPYDPATAKQLLTESGVDVAKLGTINMITYYTRPALRQRHDGDPQELGRQPRHQDRQGRRSSTTRRTRRPPRRATTTSSSSVPPTVPPATAPSTTSTPRPRYPAGGNGFKDGYCYNNPAFDKLLEQARTEFDPAKQDALYEQACQIMHDDLPWLFLWADRCASTSSARASRTSS